MKTQFAAARRPQRRRRDIFVETQTKNNQAPSGATYSARPLMPLLRSWNFICTANYKYAAPTVLTKLRTATDQQIDALVYELHGLTEDEIQLVEGGP